MKKEEKHGITVVNTENGEKGEVSKISFYCEYKLFAEIKQMMMDYYISLDIKNQTKISCRIFDGETGGAYSIKEFIRTIMIDCSVDILCFAIFDNPKYLVLYESVGHELCRVLINPVGYGIHLMQVTSSDYHHKEPFAIYIKFIVDEMLKCKCIYPITAFIHRKTQFIIHYDD